MSLDNAVRNNVLDALNGVAAFVAPTLPIVVRLMTANGTATTNGTELNTGAGSGIGAGYLAGGKAVTFASAANGAAAPTAVVRWDNMPASTIMGAELWDTSGRRYQFAPLVASKTLSSGDSFELPVANFSETLT